MATIPLRAQRTFPYAGRTIQAGQRFDALSAFDAVVLKRVGHAVDAPTHEHLIPLAEGGTDDPSNLTTTPRRTRRRPVVEHDA